MAEIKWIKIVTDVFNNRKIKQIESMPDADSILVIWFKILCLAGNINENGLLIITKDIPYTDEMLSNEFKRPLNTIRMALEVFQRFGMIEVFDNVLCVSNWEKYQNVEGMDKIREQTRKRVAKHRENKRLEGGENECNVTVTQGNATDIYSYSISKSISLKLNVETLVNEKNYSPRVKEAVENWLTYKKERRESYKETGLKSLLTQIENRVSEHGEQAVIDIINESMSNNWKGIIWDKIGGKKPIKKKINPLDEIIQEELEKEIRNGQKGNSNVNADYTGLLPDVLPER